jgi:hypothetical protein
MTTLYRRMVEVDLERNPIFTAVETLTKPKEMRAFVKDCIEYYRQHGDTPKVRQTPEAVVKINIGYVVGYYDSEIANRWMSTIDEVSHPLFGKNIPFNELQKVYDVRRR